MVRCFLHSIPALLAALCSAPAHADPVVPGEEHCVVRVRGDDTLVVRRDPHDRGAAIAVKRHDACGLLVNGPCRGNWCPVEDGHALGWVHRRHIAMVSPARYCVAGVAAGDALNLRAWPSPQSRIVARLARHQCGIAFLPYSVGAWQKVRALSGQGWVNRRYLSGQ